ncbi:MAG: tRNA preQ1(34) S-adenosylmethionine ribosyltransferase-isomerase QueA [Gemmatimonadaceae bacterium]|nr:tRNA preQ1(34) S-adenosylmethionine ribosyltransferase-isomerase QueA [Gemmatimonadaceae bacterium]MCW5825841.1 tRNA preQ1(34) S-adenosylmethionine ribosyltransferase-isomerase QueA [Gemmatimonadaceae bacterium]
MPRGLLTSDYDFALPLDRIAQAPAARRDESRLMVLDRAGGTIAHHRFRELPKFLREGDTLTLNTTRVFKARLLGTRDSGAPAEVLLLKEAPQARWEAMVQPGNKLKPGRVVTFSEGFTAEMGEPTERGTRLVRLRVEGARAGDRAAERVAIAAHGHVPLPPYIERGDTASDLERYQTVYARQEGSVAAPTAGLHFTPELLAALETQGVRRAEVLLHVGAGTFKPVEVEDPSQHEMHEEWYDVSEETASALTATRRAGHRVGAVGTTALRTLETVWREDGHYAAGSGETRIFIRPPAVVRSADVLITNFHLPRSTLLMLVAAFAGYEFTMEAYATAVREGYRFYSYGDAMLIL